MKFSIGCDPEVFLINKYGKHKSAVGLIGGSKWEPRPLDDKGNAILEDNVSVEFNIAPATSFHEFRDNIRYVMGAIKEVIPKGLEFSQESAVSFAAKELRHPQALEFGCEPDFNAWTMDENPRPKADDKRLRSCGGHVHVGVDGMDPVSVIRAMDLYLGVPSVVLDNGSLRRQLYGKAGSFRPKPYGAEYRTLSNFWIFKDELIEWVFNQTNKALDFVAGGKEIDEQQGLLIQRAINEGDLGAYQALQGV